MACLQRQWQSCCDTATAVRNLPETWRRGAERRAKNKCSWWFVWGFTTIINVAALAVAVWACHLLVFKDKHGYKTVCTTFEDMNEYVCVLAANQAAWGIIAIGQGGVGLFFIGMGGVGLISATGMVTAGCHVFLSQLSFNVYCHLSQVSFSLYKCKRAQAGSHSLWALFHGAASVWNPNGTCQPPSIDDDGAPPGGGGAVVIEVHHRRNADESRAADDLSAIVARSRARAAAEQARREELLGASHGSGGVYEVGGGGIAAAIPVAPAFSVAVPVAGAADDGLPAAACSSVSVDHVEQLTALHRLHVEGGLSDSEYAHAKAAVLAAMKAGPKAADDDLAAVRL